MNECFIMMMEQNTTFPNARMSLFSFPTSRKVNITASAEVRERRGGSDLWRRHEERPQSLRLLAEITCCTSCAAPELEAVCLRLNAPITHRCFSYVTATYIWTHLGASTCDRRRAFAFRSCQYFCSAIFHLTNPPRLLSACWN